MRKELVVFQERFAAAHPDLLLRIGPANPLTHANLNSLVRANDVAYLEYVVTGDNVGVFILKQNELSTVHELKYVNLPVNADELRSKVNEFHLALAERQPEYVPLGRELYRLLISPVANELQKTRPGGGLTEITVNVRVVAATNRNLPEEIKRGQFRQDLFYRMAVLTIHIPPLRERVCDIKPLTEYFLRDAKLKLKISNQLSINDQAITALARYAWPGNVRQLRHVVERLVVGAGNKSTISFDDVADVVNEIRRFETPSEIPLGFRENDTLDEFVARATLGLYNHFWAVAGNHSEVARILGIHRNTLYLRVERARRILQAS